MRMKYVRVKIIIKSVLHGKSPDLKTSGFTGASIFHWLSENSLNSVFKQKYTPENIVSEQSFYIF